VSPHNLAFFPPKFEGANDITVFNRPELLCREKTTAVSGFSKTSFDLVNNLVICFKKFVRLQWFFQDKEFFLTLLNFCAI
jgi:hypothetical protein